MTIEVERKGKRQHRPRWTGAAAPRTNRFWLLLIALVALLIGYPYFENTRTGAFFGGVTALWALIGGVYVVRAHRRTFGVALALALATAAASVRAFLGGVRGDAVVEAAFSAFYAFTTVVIFLEVIKTRRVTSDTLYGAICVYLLVGMTFGSLYDMIETLSTVFTLEPGDLIATGTAGGVGAAMQPRQFLRAGDVVRIQIEGIGYIENPVIDEPPDTARI